MLCDMSGDVGCNRAARVRFTQHDNFASNAMIAIAITYVPHYARLARASVLSELSKDYVTASRVS